MTNLSLRSIETDTWKARHQDGLFDIYFGLLMWAIALSALVQALGAPHPSRIISLVVLQGAAAGAYALAKRRLTSGRLGAVRFGAPRLRRSRRLGLLLGACVVITAGIVVLTAMGRSPLGLLSQLGEYALPTAVALIVGIPLTVVAIALQLTRVLVHAAFFAIAGFSLAAAGRSFMDPVGGSIAFGASGTASITIGLVYLHRFLRRRRVSEEETPS